MVELTKEEAQAVLNLLSRVNLQANEAEAFIELKKRLTIIKSVEVTEEKE